MLGLQWYTDMANALNHWMSISILFSRLQTCNHLLQRGWSQFVASGWSSGVQTEPSSTANNEICPGILEKSFCRWCFESYWRSAYSWNFHFCGRDCKSVRQWFLYMYCTFISNYYLLTFPNCVIKECINTICRCVTYCFYPCIIGAKLRTTQTPFKCYRNGYPFKL